MTPPHDMDVDELLRFHEFIGSLICEELGHDWEKMNITGNLSTMTNTERCTRCGETRADPNFSSTDGTFDFTGDIQQ